MSSLLEVGGLRVSFRTRGLGQRRTREVLHGVDLAVDAGQTFGLVGESGSGKTTLGRAILGLVRPDAGTITFDGHEITYLPRRQRRTLARHVQAVFQDPYTSLNPVMTVADILCEPLRAHGQPASAARAVVGSVLEQVGLPASAAARLPHEFSGGQRQRIAIARALAVRPKLVICDEPVSALDLSTQARILDLLIEIQEQTGVAYLFVSHDIAVVRHISHRVGVMYDGRLVEEGPAAQVTSAPDHPYTQRLLLSCLVADPDEQARRRTRRRAVLNLAAGALESA